MKLLLSDEPKSAQIIKRTQNAPTIFTLKCRFEQAAHQQAFSFEPGQFNMMYLYGVGEVAISIVSDPVEKKYFSHTIRAVGRTTQALSKLNKGDFIGVRGPYGRGWPLFNVQHKDILIVTGGLGCAPTVSIINYMLARRSDYGSIKILQGVKHASDFIFQKLYQQWQQMPEVEVYVAANQAGPKWPFQLGYVTDMIASLQLNVDKTVVMMCGPEAMMIAAVQALVEKGVSESNIFLSMERNMHCGVGHCGHCQYGGLFVCKNGPVFSYPEIKPLITVPGF